MSSQIKTFRLTGFNDIKDVALFSKAADTIESDVRILTDKYIVNGKSILGVTSIMLEKNQLLEIAYANEAELVSSIEALSAWICE